MATPRSVSFLFQYRTASLEMQSKKNRARRGSFYPRYSYSSGPFRFASSDGAWGAAGAAADCLFQ